MPRILVVDDEPNLRDNIVMVLRARRYDVDAAASGQEAVSLHAQHHPAAVVLDLLLPDMSGVDVLKQLRRSDPTLPCIMITGHGTIRSAVEAMQAGAYDYLTKPFDNNDLVLRIERALEHRKLTSRVIELEEDLAARKEFGSLVGRSQAIQLVLRRLAKVARNNANVVLAGETGTGKGLAALSLHRGSPRANGPFVVVNCAAITPSLAESELFGHTRGAFTDAKVERRGYFEQANGGTLFFDEVAELSSDLQAKLLHVIEARHVHRVGSEELVPLDVRLITATNRDLAADVKNGRFREDLFWRLNVFQVEMPALRDRMDDLPLLVERLLEIVNAECRTDITGLSGDVWDRFRGYAWPGNIRELSNVLKHAAVMAEDPIVQLADLPGYFATPAGQLVEPDHRGAQLQDTLAETERQLLEATLARFQGNRTAAAAALGITRRTLYNKLKQPKPFQS